MTNPIATTTPLAELSRQRARRRSPPRSGRLRGAAPALGLSLDLTRGKPPRPSSTSPTSCSPCPRRHGTRPARTCATTAASRGWRSCARSSPSCSGSSPAQVVAGGNSSLTMMHDVLVDLLLYGGVDSPRPWSQEEKVRFICPVPGYDRHFTMLESFGIEMVTVPMHDDGPDAEAVARARRARPERQGHVDRPDLRQPVRRRRPRRRSPPALASMHDGRARLQDLLGQRLRLPPPHRGRGQERRHPQPGRRGRPPEPADHVRLDLEDHLSPAPAWPSSAASAETVAVVPRPPRQGRRSAPTRSTTCGTPSSSARPQGVRDHMGRHREIIAPKFAEVERVLTERLGGLGVAEWTHPTGGYFVNLDVARRHRLARRPARQGGRHRPDPGRGVVPPRQRPARPQHPPRADLPRARRGHCGDGGRRHLRAPRRRREAPPTSRRARRDGGRGPCRLCRASAVRHRLRP